MPASVWRCPARTIHAAIAAYIVEKGRPLITLGQITT
jgi:hypothetical protein